MLMILDPSLPWYERRVVRYSEAIREALGDDRFSPRAWTEGTAPVPVLHDPATLGCLLTLVREVWGEPSLSLMPVDESVPLHWMWVDGGLAAPMMGCAAWHDEFPSEAEALVAALEAAP